jgi:hypothetical protein
MNYLELLRQVADKHAPPPGGLAGRTPFARVYSRLLPSSRSFASGTLGATRCYFYDGEELTKSVLVQLRLRCAKDGVDASLETVRQAAMAPAAANPAGDPWEGEVRAWLEVAIANASPGGDGPVTRITIRGVPRGFVAMRDIKLEFGAYGAPGTRRIRLTMKALGWRERRAFAWGRRMLGFVRIVDRAAGENGRREA